MITLFYILVGSAFIIMMAGLVLAFKLRRIAKGGAVGKVVNILILLILCFVSGYGVALFMPGMKGDTAWLMTAGIFLLGAVFVVLVLWLIIDLTKKIFAELGLD